MTKATHFAENALLVIIGILTLAGAAEAIYQIYERRDVELQDLLLMFLYTEVLAMAGTYYESKRIPITFPIFIAITALSRLAILQKEQEPIDLLYEAGAILMLAIASYVLELRGSKFSQSPAPAAQTPAAGQPGGQETSPGAKASLRNK
jgi:protein PsiE